MNPTSIPSQKLGPLYKQSIAVIRKANLYWIIFILNLFVCHAGMSDNIEIVSSHGTMIVAYFVSGYIIFGADSKVIDTQNGKVERAREECKIATLGPLTFFSETGLHSVIDRRTSQQRFDGATIASHVFKDGMSAREVSSAWTNAMESEYAKLLLDEPDNPFWQNDEIMVVGILVEWAKITFIL